MSGLGRAFADLALRNDSAMRAAQAAYDNRAPDDAPGYSAQELLQSISWAEDRLGRAERAINDGDLAAAIDLLREAGTALIEEMDGVA